MGMAYSSERTQLDRAAVRHLRSLFSHQNHIDEMQRELQEEGNDGEDIVITQGMYAR